MSFTPEAVEAILTKRMKEFSDEIGEILRERQSTRDPDHADWRLRSSRCALGALSLARDEIRALTLERTHLPDESGDTP